MLVIRLKKCQLKKALITNIKKKKKKVTCAFTYIERKEPDNLTFVCILSLNKIYIMSFWAVYKGLLTIDGSCACHTMEAGAFQPW